MPRPAIDISDVMAVLLVIAWTLAYVVLYR